MGLYLLDDSLRRIELITEFETLIWTERRRRCGDFVLVLNPNQVAQSLNSVTRLGIDDSNRVMTIKKIELFTDNDDVEKIKVSGKSLESIMEQRSNQVSSISGASPADERIMTGTPANIARTLFSDVCRTNSLIPDDNIPFIQSGSITSPGSIAEPGASVEIQFGLETLYSSEVRVADTYDLGFRLIKDGDTSHLYFEVYTGTDRSIGQSTRNAVIFNAQLDSMVNRRQLSSSSEFKNVAYVYSQNASIIVIAEGIAPDVDGFDRNVLIVNADDIDLSTGPSLNAALIQRGKEALAKTRVTHIFDCQNKKYIYGVDYNLGDVVTQVDDNGLATTMRIEEQTFVIDVEGTRDYPTLTG